MDLWSCAGFHTKHLYRWGYWALVLGRAFGWEWWLSFSDQKPHFQDLSLSFHLLSHKQCGDCLKVPEELLCFLSQAQVSVTIIGWLCWCDILSTQWGHGVLFKEKYPWLHHPRRNHTQINGMLLLAEPMEWSAECWSSFCSQWFSPAVFPRGALPTPSVPIKRKKCQKESWELQVFRYFVAKNWGERWKNLRHFLGKCSNHVPATLALKNMNSYLGVQQKFSL